MFLTSFLVYVFATIFTPGPNNMISMSKASRHGYRHTLNFIFGICLGFLMLMLVCGSFNLALFWFIPKIKLPMSILGSLYMAYLAVKIMKSRSSKKEQNDEKLNAFFSGLILQFINPKGVLFGITVFSTFIIPFRKSSISLILFSMFLMLLAFLATSCWAFFGTLFQKFLSKYERAFNMTMGLLLMFSAFSIYF